MRRPEFIRNQASTYEPTPHGSPAYGRAVRAHRKVYYRTVNQVALVSSTDER
jgi:hypothetical protein